MAALVGQAVAAGRLSGADARHVCCGAETNHFSRPRWVWPVEAFHSPYVRHGIVALEANPRQKFPLYRSDEVLRGSGQVVRGNEWWRLSTVSGPVVIPINEEKTRFRGDRSQIFALELLDS